MLRTLSLTAPLLVACAATPQQPDTRPVHEIMASCSMTGEANAGLSAAEACALFREAIAAQFASKSPDVRYHITLSVPSPYRAVAVVRDGNGVVLLEQEQTVMDATLHRRVWQGFARSVSKGLAERSAR